MIAPDRVMPVRVLVQAGASFGFTENNLRVALARVLSRGLVERDERGQYRLAPDARAVQSHVVAWTRLRDRMTPWSGGWIGVHLGAVRRGSRAEHRRRQRALDFLGLRELTHGLWVRPDNLVGGVADVRGRLHGLGLEQDAPVFAMADVDDATDARARGLWDTAALRAGYRDMVARLEHSAAGLADLPLEHAMVEAFLLGRQAIRLLVFDPLLPEPLVAAAEREAVVDCMIRYDRQGHDTWTAFMRQQGGPAPESLQRRGSLDTTGTEMAPAGGVL